MNKQIEALKMAIESMYDAGFFIDGDVGYPIFFEKAIKACEKALAEAEKQEPVAWTDLEGNFTVSPNEKFWYPFPLYTHPVTWQSLSDDEIEKIQLANGGFYKSVSFARAIEQALKEKNHG